MATEKLSRRQALKITAVAGVGVALGAPVVADLIRRARLHEVRVTRTQLGTAVTVLSSDDPIWVYEKLATLDAVSNGRAEVTVGRGSFTESFPLFGFDLKYANGPMPHEQLMRTVELYGTEVIPRVRALLR